MPATIFAGSKVKALKSTLSLNGGADVISSTTDPTSVAVDAAAGSLLLNTTSGKLYRKNDSGGSTNWSEVGSGGSGINYVTNPSAATNTTGWSTYADAAGTQPVDGTGGSPTVTWTRSTTTPLRGAGDFNFTKDAANRQGEGVATDITIDLADQAKVLTVSFDYEVLSGTYATGDLTVYLIADPSGTPVVIQPAGYQVQSGTAGTKLKQIATFQTQATGQSYRVCFHVASTSASAYSLAVDNVVVGPQTVQYGAPVTDWDKYYTPVITGSISNPALGTNTNIAKYRRVGDSLEIEWFFNQSTAGTTGSGTYYVSLPPGLSIDPSKLSSTAGGAAPMLGSATLFNNTNRGSMFVLYQDSTHFFLSGLYQAGEGEWGSGFYSLNNTTLYVRARVVVPILGWSSTVQMSNDTDTRVVSAEAGRSTNQALTSGVYSVVQFDDILKDTHGALSSGTFTVPVSGFYSVSASVIFNASSGSWAAGDIFGFQIRVDGASVREFVQRTYVSQVDPQSSLSHIVFCNAGQTITIAARYVGAATVRIPAGSGFTAVSISRLSGPSAISSTETVAGKYENTAGTTLTSSEATVPYATKKYDSHGAFNGTVFTAPVSGVYEFSSTISVQSVTNGVGQVLAGGFRITSGPEGLSAATQLVMVEWGNGVAHGQVINFTKPFKLNAGDTVEVRAFNSNNIGLATDTGVNFFSWKRVGN